MQLIKILVKWIFWAYKTKKKNWGGNARFINKCINMVPGNNCKVRLILFNPEKIIDSSPISSEFRNFYLQI